MGFNPDFHKRKSIRLKGFDYSQPGLYFVTICVKDRSHWFGEIENGKMLLNEIGEVVQAEWQKTRSIRPNIAVRDFVIMPNHLHGIVEIVYKMDPSVRPASTLHENVGIDCLPRLDLYFCGESRRAINPYIFMMMGSVHRCTSLVRNRIICSPLFADLRGRR